MILLYLSKRRAVCHYSCTSSSKNWAFVVSVAVTAHDSSIFGTCFLMSWTGVFSGVVTGRPRYMWRNGEKPRRHTLRLQSLIVLHYVPSQLGINQCCHLKHLLWDFEQLRYLLSALHQLTGIEQYLPFLHSS